MGPIRRQLLDMILRDDRYDLPASELDPLRLDAARELFAERREQIPVLRRRAEETGVNEIRSFADLVPLLFSHTVYKSYPHNLVDQGKWEALGRWLKTLSVEDPTKVVVKVTKKKPPGYPIEEYARPINLPANMSEVSIDPHARAGHRTKPRSRSRT